MTTSHSTNLEHGADDKCRTQEMDIHELATFLRERTEGDPKTFDAIGVLVRRLKDLEYQLARANHELLALKMARA